MCLYILIIVRILLFVYCIIKCAHTTIIIITNIIFCFFKVSSFEIYIGKFESWVGRDDKFPK